jgi:hypothetical protein
LESIKRDLGQEVTTGLSTKGKISLTGAACFEETSREGGKLEAISKILFTNEWEEKPPIWMYNLDTGERLVQIKFEPTNPGTYIFWRCY